MQDHLSTYLDAYIERFQVKEAYFSHTPDPELCLSIVIPAYKEPNILPTLRSLAACKAPQGVVEIIIVINAPDDAPQDALHINEGTAGQIHQWNRENKSGFLQHLLIREEALPHKHAGAGWARKIGMDEAAQRWGKS